MSRYQATQGRGNVGGVEGVAWGSSQMNQHTNIEGPTGTRDNMKPHVV